MQNAKLGTPNFTFCILHFTLPLPSIKKNASFVWQQPRISAGV